MKNKRNLRISFVSPSLSITIMLVGCGTNKIVEPTPAPAATAASDTPVSRQPLTALRKMLCVRCRRRRTQKQDSCCIPTNSQCSIFLRYAVKAWLRHAYLGPLAPDLKAGLRRNFNDYDVLDKGSTLAVLSKIQRFSQSC